MNYRKRKSRIPAGARPFKGAELPVALPAGTWLCPSGEGVMAFLPAGIGLLIGWEGSTEAIGQTVTEDLVKRLKQRRAEIESELARRAAAFEPGDQDADTCGLPKIP